MSASVKAACIQMTSGVEIAGNIERAGELIRQAHAAGAQIVGLPEVANLCQKRRKSALAAAQDEASEPALAAWRALADELGIWLLTGSLVIKVGPEKLVNRSHMIAPDGRIVARYDKLHMFDVDLAGGESYRESSLFEAGDRAVIADTPWGGAGMTICYDMRFPQLYRALAKAGADMIWVPAAFTRTTGRAHWHVLLRARAIETGAFVLAPAQCGDHEDGRSTYGHALIVSPWGEVLADGGEEPGFVMAELALEQVGQVRQMIPSLQHDRDFDVPSTPESLRASGE